MITQRYQGGEKARPFTDLEQAYRCELCGHVETRTEVKRRTKPPIMHGFKVVEVDQRQVAEFQLLLPDQADRHCCQRCLRALQSTFRTPEETVVVRSRG